MEPNNQLPGGMLMGRPTTGKKWEPSCVGWIEKFPPVTADQARRSIAEAGSRASRVVSMPRDFQVRFVEPGDLPDGDVKPDHIV